MGKLKDYLLASQEVQGKEYVEDTRDVDYSALDDQITISKFEDLVATKGADWVIQALDPAILQDLADEIKGTGGPLRG